MGAAVQRSEEQGKGSSLSLHRDSILRLKPIEKRVVNPVVKCVGETGPVLEKGLALFLCAEFLHWFYILLIAGGVLM